ncbi:hypothetical protein G7Z17_g332 [Cylindrodendrum hubeiense]|uniref:mitogen-activated protein kinase kinase n=1 Tax=Cylindrodendrum hubeiense TaxID=595255 RepID=A0A9P5HN74_9HYPO|nr:hypothetical protein G7Z17_g332 [Cylindrodendrum hubeiense]
MAPGPTTTLNESYQQYQLTDTTLALLLFKSIEHQANEIKSLIRTLRAKNDCHLVVPEDGRRRLVDIEAQRIHASFLLTKCDSAAPSRSQSSGAADGTETARQSASITPVLDLEQVQILSYQSTELVGSTPTSYPCQTLQMTSLDDFISQVICVLQPQHVLMYKTIADVPYKVDYTAEVGRGAFGTVQKVIQRQTGESLAMKTFEEILSVSARKSVLQEIVILKYCHHPNIVRFVEAFGLEDKSKLGIIMKPWAPYTL